MVCLFVLLPMSFKEILILVFLFISLVFMDHAFGVTFKRPFPNLKSQRFSVFYFSRNFIVLGVTFRFMMHFKLVLSKIQGMD